jgi:transposase InsO family protein
MSSNIPGSTGSSRSWRLDTGYRLPSTPVDTTELVTSGGRVYLAAILDLYSRFIVGWALSAGNEHDVGAQFLEHLAQLNELLVALWRTGARCPRA